MSILKKIVSGIGARNCKIPIFINTWNNRIIAREGDIFNEDLIDNAVAAAKKFDLEFVEIKDTFIMQDFHKVMTKEVEKYGFVTENLKFLKDLEVMIQRIKLPSKVIEELNWLKDNYEYSYHHIIAVMGLSARISKDFFITDEDVLKTIEAALTYDIGIGRISKNIINKVGFLNKDERNIANFHPIYSALLLAHYYKDKNYFLIEVALNHHETLDGSGYPRGIKSNDIITHIIEISDLFDALISARPFRKFYSVKEAFEICEKLIKENKITPEILPIIYSYYLFVDKYPYV